jgi:rod shape-determining protein MreC
LARDWRDTDKQAALLFRRMALGLAVIACLTAFFLWRTDNPRLSRLRAAITDAASPMVEWTSSPIRGATQIFEDFGDYRRVHEQNRELRREVERLAAWREVARQLEQENARLRALNNVRLAPPPSFVTAEIIADSGGPYAQTSVVNVGTRNGVQDGDAAVDGSGLVGRLVGVGERSGRVMHITDFNSRVPVIVRPSGRTAIVVGDNTDAPALSFLSSLEGVSLGDSVVTSGDGGVYTAGVPVGRIVALGERGGKIRPAAEFDRLEFVRILRYRPPPGPEDEGGVVSRRAPQPGDREVESAEPAEGVNDALTD